MNTARANGAQPLRPDPAGIEVEGVHKRFTGVDALRGADLSVRSGSIVALLGPSGCGKTTLLRTIAGLERPDVGTVRIGDRTVSADDVHVAPERRRVGMVFQDWALFPHLTVERNVGYGLGKENRAARVRQALEMVGLAGLEGRMPTTLSGGQQQRVALARALAPEPAVVLLDEPFSNLDTTLRIQVRAEVHRLLADLGMTTVFVTHDQEEAFVLGDEVAVMTEGQVVQQAPPSDLYTRPASRWVATFVGDANLVPGTASDGAADTPVGKVSLRERSTGPVDVLLRPEELHVKAGEAGRVRLIEFYGHDTVYEVDVGGHLVRVRAGSAPAFDRGDPVDVTFVGPPTVAYPSPSH